MTHALELTSLKCSNTVENQEALSLFLMLHFLLWSDRLQRAADIFKYLSDLLMCPEFAGCLAEEGELTETIELLMRVSATPSQRAFMKSELYRSTWFLAEGCVVTDGKERPCGNAVCTKYGIPCSGHDPVLRMPQGGGLAVGAGVAETFVGVRARKVDAPCILYSLVVVMRQAV